jgi:hypothetical protein
MARKQNRRARRSAQGPQQPARWKALRKQFLNPPSLIFIGVIVVVIGIIAAAQTFGEDAPECPPGQVWSESHGHCH